MLYSNTDHFLANITIDIAVYSQLNCGNFTAVPSTKEQVCYHFPHLVTTWPLILRLNLANTREAALQAYSCHFHDNKLNLKKNYCLFIGEPGSQEFPRLWQNPLPHVSVFLAVLLPPSPSPSSSSSSSFLPLHHQRLQALTLRHQGGGLRVSREAVGFFAAAGVRAEDAGQRLRSSVQLARVSSSSELATIMQCILAFSTRSTYQY